MKSYAFLLLSAHCVKLRDQVEAQVEGPSLGTKLRDQVEVPS